MRRAGLVLTALLATLCPQVVQAQAAALPSANGAIDPARLPAARALIDAILPPAERDAMFARMIESMMGNMIKGIIEGQGLDKIFAKDPAIGAVFARFVDRQRKLATDDIKLATPSMIAAYANVFARRFTIAEMTAITAFFTSPIGHKYQSEVTAALSDPELAAWQAEVAARGQKRLAPEIKALMLELAPLLPAQESKSHAS